MKLIKKLTDKMIEEIMKKPYKSSTELAKEFGIAASTVRGYRNKHGVFTRNTFKDLGREELLKMYDRYGSWIQVSKYYGVSKATIYNYAKKHGINTAHVPVLTEEQEKYIVSQYERMTSVQLAKQFNVSSSKIAQVWYKYGLIGKERRIYYLDNEDYFKKIDSQDKAYFLGFIASDGCIYKPNTPNKQNILRISIQKNDEEVLIKLQEALKTNKPLGYLTKKKSKREYVSLEISSNKIVEDIENVGLHERKTYGNTIANIDEKYMPAFIRGYIDGDGSITKKKIPEVTFSIAGFESNMRKIQQFFRTKNIFSNFIVDKRKKYTNESGDVFGSLVISNKTSLYAALKLIYNDCGKYYLTRKYDAAMWFINYIETSEKTRDKQIVLYYKYAVLPLC